MRTGMKIIAAAALCAALTGCGKPSEDALKPMLGLNWFAACEDVKSELEGRDAYKLLSERSSGDGQVPQRMLDYSGAELFDLPCDLTLCFTDSGLIGFNYHDVEKQQDYKAWFSTLEGKYGLPTEESSGMASWYENPLGKDTAIYLFNLEEGVQVSFYATADSPDKDYEKQKDASVPAPEIRTPIVPVTENPSAGTDAPEDAPAVTTGRVYREGDRDVLGTDPAGNLVIVVTDGAGEAVTNAAGTTVTTVVTATTGTTASTASTADTSDTDEKQGTSTASTAAPVKADRTKAFLLNGLEFYASPDTERRLMSRYTQLYEYRTEEPGQPWELIMEYENVPYLGKKCQSVLCFTSLGLVGVNYYDSNTKNYGNWVQQLTAIYGAPDDTQYDYAVWSSSPVGSGTVIYVFALADGVQISFFADDTGSELA